MNPGLEGQPDPEEISAVTQSEDNPDQVDLAAEVARLQALLEGRFKDVRLVEMVAGELVLKGTLFEYIAEFMAQMLTIGKDAGQAANYTETILNHPELGRLTLTLQRQSGATPHALRRAAEMERDAAREDAAEAQRTLLATAVAMAEAAAPLSRDDIRGLTSAQIFQNLMTIERARTAHAIADRLRSLGDEPRVSAGDWVEHLMSLRGLSREAAEMELCGALSRGMEPDREMRLPASAPSPDEAWLGERAALIAALHDAICRPKGVVPESATPWYDHRLGDLAEARRPRLTR